MKQLRWMKTVLTEAKKLDTPMVWDRKDRPKRAAIKITRLKATG
jgi:hypothetical protein